MGGASQTNVVKKDQTKKTYIYNIYIHTDLFYFKCIIKNNTIILEYIIYIYIISAYCSIPTVAYNYIATSI